MKLNIIIIAILGFSTLFVMGQAYAPCIEGLGINCNNYPPPSLSQIKLDKLNYEVSDKPIVTIMGAPDAVAHLEIDDSSSNIIFTHDINLAPNGTVGYALDISSYKPGVYSAIATSPISKLTTSFTVGLASTGGGIGLNTDKNSYFPGDNVTIFGWWNSNTMIQLSLIDPSGISVKSIQTFSDKTGHFSSLNFTIPLNAVSGIWKIGATSGVSHSQVQITINSSLDNNSNIKMDNASILSPLKQFKLRTNDSFIICKPGFYFVLKSHDREPLCLKAGTISKLASRGFLFATSSSNDNHTTVIISQGSEHQASPNTYSPDTVSVVLGVNNTVRWVNQADVADQIVSDMPLIQDGKSFGSADFIKPDQSYEFTFTEPGTFAYHTEPHPWMKGTVIVSKNNVSTQPILDSTLNGPEFKVGPDLLGPLPHQLVFFMKSNSTARVFVEYTSHEPNTGTMPSYSSVYVRNGGDYVPLTTSDVTITAEPSSIPLIDGSDTIVVYNITAKNWVNGVYWISLTQFCGVIPLAIDMNSLTISPVDIPVQTGTMHCPAQSLDRKILGISEGTAEYKVGLPVK